MRARWASFGLPGVLVGCAVLCGVLFPVPFAWGVDRVDTEDTGGGADGASTSLSELVNDLRQEGRHNRSQALFDLLAATEPSDAPALVTTMADPSVSPRIQWRLARALAMMEAESATSTLAAMATDLERAEWVRQAAVLSLGDLGGRDAAPALLAALRNDPEPVVRLMAAGAFYRVQGKTALFDLNRAAATETDDYVLDHLAWYAELTRRGDTFTRALRPGETVVCAEGGTKYLVYTPSKYDSAVQHDVLVSLHGTFGSAEHYRDIARERAEAEGVVLVAPWFDASTFPAYDNFNLDNVGIGMPRSDSRLLEILDALAEIANVRTDQFYLFGHSKGGQFVQRFVFAHSDRIIRAAACAPGIYITPARKFADEFGEMFPYGPAPNPFAPDLADRTFKDLVSAPIMFFVGSEDPRIREAYYFLREAQIRSKRYVYRQQVDLKVLPEVRHRGAETFPPAAAYLFGDAEGDARF